MQGLIHIGRRVLRPSTVALASALAIGSVRRARQKSYRETADQMPALRSSGGGARGFVATVEDRSNDRGFAASVEDRSNDTGFRPPAPVRVPETDPSRPDPSMPDKPAAESRAPHGLEDSPPEI